MEEFHDTVNWERQLRGKEEELARREEKIIRLDEKRKDKEEEIRSKSTKLERVRSENEYTPPKSRHMCNLQSACPWQIQSSKRERL